MSAVNAVYRTVKSTGESYIGVRLPIGYRHKLNFICAERCVTPFEVLRKPVTEAIDKEYERQKTVQTDG